ncbi:MAG: lipopolysaccharide transport periplasmic protein LptA [Rhodobacteraceae bacterium]|nr:lipopolysaccharide transport periplasmic protein LptA [Paracoccaceae bacterium]
MYHLRVLLTFIALLIAAPAVWAQGTNISFGAFKSDPAQPVEVTADQLDVNQEDGSATFSGNVLIGQGEMRLSAQQVVVRYRADATGIERLEASGGVTLVNGTDAAQSETADYAIDSGQIVMRGRVLLAQGPSTLSSDMMTVNLTTGTAQMTGRVKTILETGD